MSRTDPDKIRKFVSENRWLLLMLGIGAVLLLLPTRENGRTEQAQAEFTSQEIKLSRVLSRIEGVGEAYVLLAENPGRDKGWAGAVVVCRGAPSPQVRLRVVETVSAYTGLRADRIVVQNLIWEE